MSFTSNIKNVNTSWEKDKSELLVAGMFSNKNLTTVLSQLDDHLSGNISNAIKLGEINGFFGEKTYFYSKSRRVLVMGLGSENKLNNQKIRKISGLISREAIKKKIATLSVECFCQNTLQCQSMGEGFVLGSYQFVDHKTKNTSNPISKSITVLNGNSEMLEKGYQIGSSVCLARDVSNHPGNIATPSYLAHIANTISKNGDMNLKVFDRDEFTKMGMGALAGVSQGTNEPPKFIVLEYFNGDASENPKVLVGKGLTFDSGGISIKPAPNMDEMKYDMCGSSTVLGVFDALSKLKPKINVVGIIPSTENLVGGSAYKPGDILTAYNGKTIEVLNTDAEGRLILADALSYASKHYTPEYILDFATLTGAVLIALGHEATGIMGTNKKLIKSIKNSSKNVGEKVWEFPLWKEYSKQIISDVADLKNMGAPKQAGSIAGGVFLKEFVKKGIPWAHFDIAGTAWGVEPDSCNPKGSATGVAVRLVLDMLKV